MSLPVIKHTLYKPVNDGAVQLTELTFKPMTYAVYSSIDIQRDDDQVIEDFATALTDISPQAFEHISSPDFVSISEIILRQINQKSPKWVDGLTISHERVSLAMPIQGDDGRTISEIELKVPSVKTRKLLKVQPTEQKKQTFITNACTGLSETEINRLFMPDWIQLQENIDHFLNKAAGFFQSAM